MIRDCHIVVFVSQFHFISLVLCGIVLYCTVLYGVTVLAVPATAEECCTCRLLDANSDEDTDTDTEDDDSDSIMSRFC